MEELNNGKTPEQDAPESTKVEIEIVKFKWLLQALENPKILWRLIISLSAMLVILFFGLSMVAVIFKSMFPYETIKTNPYGATIMEDEKKEVVYWLFNSSELWANSGIKVKKGDMLTIRSSGMMHTAIHHLVEDVDSNRVLGEPWVDTDGEKYGNKSDRNEARAHFRIAPRVEQNRLLMKVKDDSAGDSGQDGKINIIGKERSNLLITEDGTLHFAVNDIEMTDTVVSGMYRSFMESVIKDCTLSEDEARAWREFYDKYVKVDRTDKTDGIDYSKVISEKPFLASLPARLSGSPKAKASGVGLGVYYKQDSLYPVLNEVLYYRDMKFPAAWFADNVGSFLIVIERDKEN